MLAAERRVVLLSTPALFLEYEELLKRPDQREVSGLSIGQIDTALSAIAAIVEPVQVRFAWRPQLADSDDEMVLDAAVNGQAEALITHDINDFDVAARRFGILLLRPGEALERIMA